MAADDCDSQPILAEETGHSCVANNSNSPSPTRRWEKSSSPKFPTECQIIEEVGIINEARVAQEGTNKTERQRRVASRKPAARHSRLATVDEPPHRRGRGDQVAGAVARTPSQQPQQPRSGQLPDVNFGLRMHRRYQSGPSLNSIANAATDCNWRTGPPDSPSACASPGMMLPPGRRFDPAKVLGADGKVRLMGVSSTSDIARFTKGIDLYSRRGWELREAFKMMRSEQHACTSTTTWQALKKWRASEKPFEEWYEGARGRQMLC